MSTRTPDRPRVAAPLAVATEIAAVLAALGAGQLVGAWLSPPSAPFQAVADAVVRLSPERLTEFGKTLEYPALGLGKGVADKLTLLAGIGVVLLLVAVLAGLAARRRPGPGAVVIALLGLVGLAAVATSPVFTPADLVAPLVAVGVGLAVFTRLYRLASPAPSPPLPSPPAGVSRRRVLTAAGAVGLAGLGAAVAGQVVGGGAARSRAALAGRLTPAVPAGPIPPGADFAPLGTPTFLTSNKDFYRIDTALRIPSITAEDWSLRIHGLVDRELRIRYADLFAAPLVEKTITLTCVSNEVNGNLISTANFTGVPLRDLLLRAGVRPGAEQVFSTSLDGWTAGTPVDAVLRPGGDALLALGMNGEPLPPEHGFPARLVVPGLYGYVSATKWVTDLEVTTFAARRPYWLDRGWARLGPIKTESRIDRPRAFQTLDRNAAGLVTLAGIAWAPTRGISAVEVQLDEAGPWLPAQLSTPVNAETWRMWRVDVPLEPGSHFVRSRATDGTGATQTVVVASPIPDGASGWPGIRFSVA